MKTPIQTAEKAPAVTPPAKTAKVYTTPAEQDAIFEKAWQQANEKVWQPTTATSIHAKTWKAKAADRKHFDSETLWNAIGKAAIQDAIDWKKKAAAQTSEPTTPDNLGAAIAREAMQNAVFDKAWPQGGLVISLRSSLSSIIGIPRPPSHIVP
jgi:hypothetical protein